MDHVQAGKYLVVMPNTALPRVIGDGGERMRQLCASNASQVERHNCSCVDRWAFHRSQPHSFQQRWV